MAALIDTQKPHPTMGAAFSLLGLAYFPRLGSYSMVMGLVGNW